MPTPGVSRRLLAAGTVLALAAACGGSDGESGTAAGGASAVDCPVEALDDVPAGEPVEVSVWHSYVGETRDTLLALADDYNASQDKVEVRIESQGESYEELLRKYTQAIPTADLPGLAILEDTVTQFMADSGTIVPGETCFDAVGQSLDAYLPLAVDYYSVDGEMVAASANLSTLVLYYNRDHFRRAGLDPDDPPGTLEELRSAAQAIKDAGVTEEPLVLVMQPWFVEHWLTGSGYEVVDNDNGRGEGGATAGAFDNDGAVESFTWLSGMERDGLLNAIGGTEGVADHYFAMGLEQASMTLETSTAVSTIDAFLEGTLDPGDLGLDLESLPEVSLDIGVAPYPSLAEGQAGRSQVGGGVWYIPNTNSDAVIAGAWDFVSFINEPAQQVRWNLEGSYLPFNTEAVDDPALQAAWADTRRGRWLAIAYESLLSADPDFPGPLIGPYADTRDIIRREMDELILRGKDPVAAVADAEPEITSAIERYNEENF